MSLKAETTFSLKDQLFNKSAVQKISTRLHAVDPSFDRRSYERKVLKGFPERELKERMHWMVTVLEDHLPSDIGVATPILQKALPEPLDPKMSDDDFGEFVWMVPGEYVAKHGCTPKALKGSLRFLKEATKRSTSENAIRPFLKWFPEETFEFVRRCATDSNYHVRRLASEGIRPYLPWAMRVEVPTRKILSVLDTLHADPTRYVTRSVSNTLNDITRGEPGPVLDILDRWRKANRQCSKELAWMTRHALRTLVRQDYGPALERLGFPTQPKFRLTASKAMDHLVAGESFTRSCTLTSLAKQKLKIALRIHFLKANGTHSAKLFAVKELEMAKGEQLEIEKRQPFRPLTTRTLYPGTHYSEWIVNGVARGKRAFEFALE